MREMYMKEFLNYKEIFASVKNHFDFNNEVRGALRISKLPVIAEYPIITDVTFHTVKARGRCRYKDIRRKTF